MLIEISSQLWTALVLFVLILILIVLIMIFCRLKRFTSYQPPEQNPAKLSFKDMRER